MANEVEPHIWKAASAATRRYFKTWRVQGTIQTAAQAVSASFYRTGYIMGYRAGQRSARTSLEMNMERTVLSRQILDEIDGGEEFKSRDAQLSMWANEVEELELDLWRYQQNKASNLQTIKRLEAALSWIAVGEGRAGWRGHIAHANEALGDANG